MTTRILLVRHGNTFKSGEKAVWVGARNDLPLTEEGRLQASAVADLLIRAKAAPRSIYAGPLKRQREFADIIKSDLFRSEPVSVDSRLGELDYGTWAGLSNEEISEKYGATELTAWREAGMWPKNACWPEDEAKVEAETLALLKEVRDRREPLSLLVTSNGRLRYFAKAVQKLHGDPLAAPHDKVNTGHLCLIQFEDDRAHVVFWNGNPKMIAAKTFA